MFSIPPRRSLHPLTPHSSFFSFMSTLEIYWSNLREPQLLWSWSDQYLECLSITPTQRLSTRVWLADMHPEQQYTPSQQVVIKTARGCAELEALEAEFMLYEGDLRHLQGSVVPVCHGYFKDNRPGKKAGALVLEYRPGVEWYRYPDHIDDFIASTRLLHDIGINHGNLLRDGHLTMTSNGVCIVGFSRAVRHHCNPYCPELDALVSVALKRSIHSHERHPPAYSFRL